MSFRENANQQLSMMDSFANLTPRERKALENSWAKVFADDVFPYINEGRFSVLYSSDPASRPNAPVNVIVGALIIKELFDYTDDEMVENLMLDPRMQYALHTTSFEEQPLSDKSLSRFRKRCYEYETNNGVDLYHECIAELSSHIAKLMNISGKIRRMDSMMIEANIRTLSRMELLYTCIANVVKVIHKTDENAVPENLKHYADPNDYNRFIYHQRSTEAADRMLVLLGDADVLTLLCRGKYDSTSEYHLFMRCLGEQTVVEDGSRRLRAKDDPALHSNILQNPSDPEATFRTKAGKDYRGYAANLEESVGENGSVVTEYQYDCNTKSDSEFLKDHLEKMDTPEEPILCVTDGAYSGSENTALARAKNVKLVTTALSGREVNDICADFKFNEAFTRVTECPAGHIPKHCHLNPTTNQFSLSFDVAKCANCPHKDQCKAVLRRRVAHVKISKVAHDRAENQRNMKTEEHKNLARLRNGVETVPSNLRRNYNLEKLPRGKQRGKFFFGCKVMALNVVKLVRFRRGEGNYAQNPVLA